MKGANAFGTLSTALSRMTTRHEGRGKRSRESMESIKKETASGWHKVWGIIGIVLCVMLIPVLLVNVILIIKSYTHQEEVPAIGGYSPLIILTGSMEPAIATGDLIIVRTVQPQDVHTGDIIAFFDPDGNGTSVLTHRVTKIIQDGENLSFYTKGDANNTEDRNPVSADKLIGLYQTRYAGMGHVAMFMQTPAGLVICVAVPLILLVGWDIIRRRHSEKCRQTDTDALLAELNALKARTKPQETDKIPVMAGTAAVTQEQTGDIPPTE